MRDYTASAKSFFNNIGKHLSFLPIAASGRCGAECSHSPVGIAPKTASAAPPSAASPWAGRTGPFSSLDERCVAKGLHVRELVLGPWASHRAAKAARGVQVSFARVVIDVDLRGEELQHAPRRFRGRREQPSREQVGSRGRDKGGGHGRRLAHEVGAERRQRGRQKSSASSRLISRPSRTCRASLDAYPQTWRQSRVERLWK